MQHLFLVATLAVKSQHLLQIADAMLLQLPTVDATLLLFLTAATAAVAIAVKSFAKYLLVAEAFLHAFAVDVATVAATSLQLNESNTSVVVSYD